MTDHINATDAGEQLVIVHPSGVGVYCCAVCGMPTETEPCPEHQPNAYAEASGVVYLEQAEPTTYLGRPQPGAAPHHYGPDDVVVDGDWLHALEVEHENVKVERDALAARITEALALVWTSTRVSRPTTSRFRSTASATSNANHRRMTTAASSRETTMTDSAMIAKQARSMVEGMPLTGTVGVYASWLTGVADALEAQQAKITEALALHEPRRHDDSNFWVGEQAPRRLPTNEPREQEPVMQWRLGKNDDDTVDEVVMDDASVHLEDMGDAYMLILENSEVQPAPHDPVAPRQARVDLRAAPDHRPPGREWSMINFEVKPQCYCQSSFDGEGDGMCPVHRADGSPGWE